MNKRLCRGLVLALGLALALAGCSRRKGNVQTNSHPAGQSVPANSASVTSSAPQSRGASAAEQDRPSPFVPRQTAARIEPAVSPKSTPEPLVVATVEPAGSKVTPTFPTPPVIRPPAADTSRIAPFLDTMCCVATATYEPVRPNGFQRVIQKVPGLRRLDRSAAADPSYTPPLPLFDIRFALPPNDRRLLMGKQRMDLKASLDATGRVTIVELLSPRNEPLADLAAGATHDWRFTPAESNGSPAPAEVLLHFDFANAPAQAAMSASRTQ